MTKNIVLLGDSITQGLGSKKINFTHELKSLLGEDFLLYNLALTGTTINYVNKIMKDILDKKPDCIIIFYGNVDAQIRPNSEGCVFKYIPSRFKKGGMLMPRPFYSSKFYKRIFQKLDNFIRLIFSKLIYWIDGSEQWVSIENFKKVYEEIILSFLATNIKVIVCSTVFIDDKKFKGTLQEYKNFNEVIKKLSLDLNLRYVDLFSILESYVLLNEDWHKYYCFDHFHPNEYGYKIIAEKLSIELNEVFKNGEIK